MLLSLLYLEIWIVKLLAIKNTEFVAMEDSGYYFLRLSS